MTTFIPNGLLDMMPNPEYTGDVPNPFTATLPVMDQSGHERADDASPNAAGTVRSQGTDLFGAASPQPSNSFIPNGLLAPTSMRRFVPNGLLDHVASVSEGNLSPQGSLPPAASVGSVPQADKEMIETANETTAAARFVSNGILDFAPSSARTVADDIQMETVAESSGSQDETLELPSLSTILGVPSLGYRPRPGGATGTTFSSRTVRFPRRTKTKTKTQPRRNAQDNLQLLERPIHRLLDDLALDAIKPAAKRDEARQPGEESCLWVDRYRPKRFPDLLGDDRIHRETMAWLKEWDTCVFGKKKGKKRARENEPNFDGYEDAYGRPYEKILLLSGPPGLGKTTLAHVIATTAGYAVLEINASDERAARVVDERIRPALEAGTSVGGKKPVCVVIDEIDGVGGAGGDSNAFIQKLIQLTLDKPKRKNGGRRNGKESRPLLRPIVCICNDLYATSLRALRPHARSVRVKPPTPLLLANRLRDVCIEEGLRADGGALAALVGLTKGDIRTCLNTLQFIQSRTDEVTEAVVRSATVGLKDMEVSTQAVWDDIFLPLSKKRVKQLGLTEEAESRYVGRLHWAIEATDEVERVMQGCFSHYPRARTRDSAWVKYEKAHSWLEAFDAFTGSFRGGDDIIWALREYRAYCVVAFAPLFSAMGNPKAEWPSADYNCFVTSKANEEIFSSFAKELSAESSRTFTQDVYPTEFLPLLNRIISPPIRTTNSQIVKTDERTVLNKLVTTMADLKLRFVQEKTEEGQLVYRLDPPIDVFITYDEKRSGDVGASRYALRHLVAQQVDAELAKRSTEIVERGKAAKVASFFGSKSAEPIMSSEATAQKATGSAARKGPQPGASVDPADKPPVDFFGRPLPVFSNANKASVQLHSGADKHGAPSAPPGPAKKFRVAYKFHEGNSAAVRRPVKIASLL